MNVRAYDHKTDYERINRFLIEIYRPAETLDAWLQSRWEYIHHHPLSDGLPWDQCGIAEVDDMIVGFIHFEDHPAFNYIQIRPGYERYAEELLDWAIHHLGGTSPRFEGQIRGIFVSDYDNGLEQRVAARGYEPHDDIIEEHARYVIDEPIESGPLPDGFHLHSLDDDNNFTQINRVLWRGFNHRGPPPASEIEGRKAAQAAPHFRKDLTIVATAPNGDYASFVGMWVVPDNQVAYVEPVATDPTFRQLGLASAALRESMRRVAGEGIKTVWVGSGLPFYQDLGFNIRNRSRLWVKRLSI